MMIAIIALSVFLGIIGLILVIGAVCCAHKSGWRKGYAAGRLLANDGARQDSFDGKAFGVDCMSHHKEESSG